MALFKSPPCIIIFAFIIVLHVLSRIFSGKLSALFSLVNIALHALIAPIMLLNECELSELALVYTVSLFVFLLSIYVKGGGEKGDV